jgi:hypothetical protein
VEWSPNDAVKASDRAAAAQGATIVIALVFGMHSYPESSVLEILAVNGLFMTG